MIDFRDIKPGQARTFDWDGESVVVAAESETVYWVSKYVDGGAWKVARLSRDPDAEDPWTVTPMSALHDDEAWSNWGGALRTAADMKVEMGDYVD
jgi:hypothetical protein